MEGKQGTNATQNFGHQPDLRSMVKNALKVSTNVLPTSEDLCHNPLRHFRGAGGVGCHHSHAAFSWGATNGQFLGLENAILFGHARTQVEFAATALSIPGRWHAQLESQHAADQQLPW